MMRKASSMPIGPRPACDFLKCLAGMGLAGMGTCFLGGNWANPNCEKFMDQTAWYLEGLLSERMSQYAGEVE